MIVSIYEIETEIFRLDNLDSCLKTRVIEIFIIMVYFISLKY